MLSPQTWLKAKRAGLPIPTGASLPLSIPEQEQPKLEVPIQPIPQMVLPQSETKSLLPMRTSPPEATLPVEKEIPYKPIIPGSEFQKELTTKSIEPATKALAVPFRPFEAIYQTQLARAEQKPEPEIKKIQAQSLLPELFGEDKIQPEAFNKVLEKIGATPTEKTTARIGTFLAEMILTPPSAEWGTRIASKGLLTISERAEYLANKFGLKTEEALSWIKNPNNIPQKVNEFLAKGLGELPAEAGMAGIPKKPKLPVPEGKPPVPTMAKELEPYGKGEIMADPKTMSKWDFEYQQKYGIRQLGVGEVMEKGDVGYVQPGAKPFEPRVGIKYSPDNMHPIYRKVIIPEEYKGITYEQLQAKGIKPTPTIAPKKPLPEAEKGITTPSQGIGKIPPEKPPAPPTIEPMGNLDPLIPNPTPENIGLFKRIKNATKSKLTSIREWVDDRNIRIKKLIDINDAKIAQGEDVYSAMKLYPGRVDTRLRLADNIVTDIDKSIITKSKEFNISGKSLIDDVNEYLISKHAPERNIMHGEGAAGMTTAEAKINLKKLGGSSHFNDIKGIADKISDLNYQTLEILKDSQVISDELYNTLRKTYKNHVPLNRVFAETDDIVDVLSSRGLSVKGTGIKRAVGSEREVADIMTNVTANYKAAIMRAEKNRVDLATLALARTPEMKATGLFTEIKPKAIGKTFGGQYILEQVKDPLVLTLREQGKPVHLKINDPNLSIAFQGIGKEYLPQTLKAIGTFTRTYSGLMTRFNPEFALPNMIRDIQETMIYLSAQKEMGIKRAFKTVSKEASSAKAVLDSIRGIDSPGAKLYNQLKMDGGTTGGMALSTRQQVEFDINKIRQLNRSNPRKAAKYILEKVDNWNTIFEDATRLSVYKQALENGATRSRAAVLAKEASIDFNKMGRGGPVVNALWMFSNASIQGTTKLLGAMKNPKVLGVVVGSVGTAVIVVNRYNDMVDPDWRNKASKWDRMNGLIVMIPGTNNYITVPVSWGIKPIKVSMDAIYDFMVDKSDKDVKETTINILSSMMDAYNPAGGTDVISAITPSILDVPVDIGRNRGWWGGKIKPDITRFREGRRMVAPEDMRYYPELEDSLTGNVLIKGTEKLADLGIEISPADIDYAFQQYIGGAGRFLSKTLNTATAFTKLELPPVKEMPFVSRFLRTSQGSGMGLPVTESPDKLSPQEWLMQKRKLSPQEWLKQKRMEKK